MIETVTVTPQDVPPVSKLVDPLWWLKTGGTNATWTAPEINNGQPYLPTIDPRWLRNLLWWFRNPAGNLMGFILGFEGRTYTVTGPAPVLATTLRDVGQIGWKWSIINYWAPFVSYWGGVGIPIEFYLGWRPASGGLGFKFVIAHA